MRPQNDTNKYGPNYSQPVEPANKWSGCLWFDTTTNKLKVWTGTFWRWDGMDPISGGDFGFVVGGTNTVTYVSIIERITMPFNGGISTVVGNNKDSNSCYGGGYFNSSTYGYMLAGFSGTAYVSNINTIQFPFDSGTTVQAGNTEPTRSCMGGCNSSIAGYGMGGMLTSTAISFISKLVFSSNIYVQSVANLSLASEQYAACNSSIHGFVFGGNNSAGGTSFYSKIQRMVFSADTTTAISTGNLSVSKRYNAVANSSIHGFSISGDAGGVISSTDRISFPFDSGSVVTPMTPITITSGNTCSFCSSPYSTYGFGLAASSNIIRLDFPYDSGQQIISGYLSQKKSASTSPDNTDFVAQFV